MSEEIRNEVVETEVLVPADEYEYGYDDEIEEEENGGFLKGALVAGGTLIVGGATAFAIKKRDKIAAKLQERQIRRLEKKGFEVIGPEIEDETEVEAEVVVEDEKNSKK